MAGLAAGHDLGMEAGRIISTMRYSVLAMYVFALAALVWSAVLGINLAINSSVVGGVATTFAALILMAVAGWRINVTWKQLRAFR